MDNTFRITIYLDKLGGAFTHTLKGRTGEKECLIIPLEGNRAIYKGAKGVYLNLVAHATQASKFGDSHILNESLPREILDTLKDENGHYNMPIVGNVRPLSDASFRNRTQQDGAGIEEEVELMPDDGLPF